MAAKKTATKSARRRAPDAGEDEITDAGGPPPDAPDTTPMPDPEDGHATGAETGVTGPSAAGDVIDAGEAPNLQPEAAPPEPEAGRPPAEPAAAEDAGAAPDLSVGGDLDVEEDPETDAPDAAARPDAAEDGGAAPDLGIDAELDYEDRVDRAPRTA